LLPRYVPPSGFGCPLGGLLPSIPGRLCFAPAALVGFTLRSFLLSHGFRKRFRSEQPTCRFFPPVTPAAKAEGRPGRTAAPGSYLARIPCDRRVISTAARRMLPWVFSLLGLLSEGLGRDFARPPLTRLAKFVSRRTQNRPRRRVSINLRPASPSMAASRQSMRGNPSRVFAPC